MWDNSLFVLTPSTQPRCIFLLLGSVSRAQQFYEGVCGNCSMKPAPPNPPVRSFKPGSAHKALLFPCTGGERATHATIGHQKLGPVQPKCSRGQNWTEGWGVWGVVTMFLSPHLEMVACVYTNSESLQSHIPKQSDFLPPGLLEDTGWGFQGGEWVTP